jgi:hypothetical protein
MDAGGGEEQIRYTNGGQCRGYVYEGRVFERGVVIVMVAVLSSLCFLNVPKLQVH